MIFTDLVEGPVYPRVRKLESEASRFLEVHGPMTIISEWNQAVVEEFRANGGEVGGRFTGRNLLLLHTIGKKSGEERINPLAYVRDRDRYVIIASKGGADTHPDWYYNLIAHPAVTVEVGTEAIQVHAVEAQEPERSRLYEKMVEMMPVFGEYRRKTTRAIPVLILTKGS